MWTGFVGGVDGGGVDTEAEGFPGVVVRVDGGGVGGGGGDTPRDICLPSVLGVSMSLVLALAGGRKSALSSEGDSRINAV